jgi:hypothetical protein
MSKLLTVPRSSREMRAAVIFVLSMAIPAVGIAQVSVTGLAPVPATETDPTSVT